MQAMLDMTGIRFSERPLLRFDAADYLIKADRACDHGHYGLGNCFEPRSVLQRCRYTGMIKSASERLRRSPRSLQPWIRL